MPIVQFPFSYKARSTAGHKFTQGCLDLDKVCLTHRNMHSSIESKLSTICGRTGPKLQWSHATHRTDSLSLSE